MPIQLEVKQADVLTVVGDALILSFDGAAPGMEGAIARQFDHRFPDAELLEEIKAQVRYPVPLGSAALVELYEGSSPYKAVILASTLHHLEVLDQSGRAINVINAFGQSLELCQQAGFSNIVTPVLSGGWRLSTHAAFSAMLQVLSGYRGESKLRCVTVCSIEPIEHLCELCRTVGF